VEGQVPLSEDEQRILSEIERRLNETDPHLAREVGSTTVFTHAARAVKWGAVGFIAGTALLLSTLSRSSFFAFVGFLVMLASALVIERNARRLGRAGLAQVTERRRAMRDELGVFGQRMRDRFRRDER
jgi:hypothetical protein